MDSDAPFHFMWWMVKLVEVPIGIATTFMGILLVYLVARPRVKFDDSIRLTHESTRDRVGVRIAALGWIPILELKVTAYLSVKGPSRSTSVPVPLSRDTWTNVKRQRDPKKWRVSPRLLIQEVDWDKHLPSRLPMPGASLEAIMKELKATLFVRVTASSMVFGVSAVRTHKYKADDWTLSADSLPTSQRID